MKKILIFLSILTLTISCNRNRYDPTIYKVKDFGIHPNTGLVIGDTLQGLFNSLALKDSLNKGYIIQFEDGVYEIGDSSLKIIPTEKIQLKSNKKGKTILKRN